MAFPGSHVHLDAFGARQVPRSAMRGPQRPSSKRECVGTAHATARRGPVQWASARCPQYRPLLPVPYRTRSGASDRDCRDRPSYGCTGTEKTLVAQLVSAPAGTFVSLWMYSTPMKMRPLKNWLAE